MTPTKDGIEKDVRLILETDGYKFKMGSDFEVCKPPGENRYYPPEVVVPDLLNSMDAIFEIWKNPKVLPEGTLKTFIGGSGSFVCFLGSPGDALFKHFKGNGKDECTAAIRATAALIRGKR